MPTATWTVGSASTTDTPFVYTDFYKDATFTITTPRNYTIESMQWYASAETVNVVYCSCELYLATAGTLIARSTKRLINATTLQAYNFTRTSNNGGGPWAYNLTSSTTFAFRIKFRNTSGSPKTCTYYAWLDFTSSKVPYGVITVSYPGSGAYVMTSSGSWTKRPVKVWNGSSWVRRPVKVWNGSSWVTR
jgi:hypothetical protein